MSFSVSANSVKGFCRVVPWMRLPAVAMQPSLQLLIGIGQGSELTKGHKTVFDVLDTGFHPALFLGSLGGHGEIKNPYPSASSP